MFQRLSKGTGSGNSKITLLFKNIHNFPFIAPDILQSAGAKIRNMTIYTLLYLDADNFYLCIWYLSLKRCMVADSLVLTAPTEAVFEFLFTL